MRTIRIDPTFPSWRQAARALLMEGVEPRGVEWREAEDDQASLGLSMEAEALGVSQPSPGLRVSRRFVELAEAAACHADSAARPWAASHAPARPQPGEPAAVNA